MASTSKLEQEITELKAEYKALNLRVQKLENYFAIAIAVAAIFGIAGGTMVKKIFDLNDQAASAERKLKEAETEFTKARDKAVKETEDKINKITGRYDTNFVVIRKELAKKTSAKLSEDIIPFHSIDPKPTRKGGQ